MGRDGAKVIVNYVTSAADAKAVVDAIVTAGGSATAVKADVSTIAGGDFLFAEAKRIYGKVRTALNVFHYIYLHTSIYLLHVYILVWLILVMMVILMDVYVCGNRLIY